MSTKKALLPTPATSPERGTQTLISASRSDPLARAIDVPPPIPAVATIAPAINFPMVFMVAPVGGVLVVEVLRQQVRRPTPIGSRQQSLLADVSGERPAHDHRAVGFGDADRDRM